MDARMAAWPFVVGFGIGCLEIYLVHGPRALVKGRPAFVGLPLVVLALAWLARPLPGSAWSGLWFIGFGLIGLVTGQTWALIATWPWRMRQAGPLLLALDRGKGERKLCVAGILFIAIGIMYIVIGISERYLHARALPEDPGRFLPLLVLSGAAGVLSLAAFFLLTGWRGPEVRENGLWRFDALIRWPQIAGYEWETNGSLTLKYRPSYFVGRQWTLAIPPHQKEALARILAQHVSSSRPEAGGSA